MLPVKIYPTMDSGQGTWWWAFTYPGGPNYLVDQGNQTIRYQYRATNGPPTQTMSHQGPWTSIYGSCVPDIHGVCICRENARDLICHNNILLKFTLCFQGYNILLWHSWLVSLPKSLWWLWINITNSRRIFMLAFIIPTKLSYNEFD